MTAGDVWGDPGESPALTAALEAYAAGLCVIPPREDGTKAPDVASWTRYQAERPTEAQLRGWYAKGRTGVGVICGQVSGGLEMLELEGRAVAEGVSQQFRELCDAAGLGELLSRILRGYTERTPLGGLHLLYRVPTPKGNTKLARRPATPQELAEKPDDPIRVLIETRGKGGFVVTAPSAGSVHPTGRPWTLEVGGFDSIASITDEEREELWRAAQAIDQLQPEAPRQSRRNGEERPGDRYGELPDVQQRTVELLERHGWSWVATRGEVELMRRPGKDIGISGTVGFAARGVLHVFSTSVAGLEPGRSHSPFTVLTQLEYGGDPSAAAAGILTDLPDVVNHSARNVEPRAQVVAEPAAEPRDRWPEPPADPAYHGLAGELVRAVVDHTEADPVAILGSILATFGALAGHGRGIYQGSSQSANIYVALVGDSSSGRKGTAGSIAREIFNAAVSGWDSILVPGLGSGEGLIRRLKPDDEGNAEHRALVHETELGRLLASMAREGSTLSPMLRDGWDGVPLGRFLARSDALVTHHHVGVLAHITPVELRARLTGVDAANGFGNRFLWLAVRRTRLVPIPGNPRALIEPYAIRLRRAIDAAQDPAELTWTGAAAERWQWVYAELAGRSRLGLAGSITARAEAQVVRLALIYALLAESPAVDEQHLEAGLAFWNYAERSARYLFGDSTGNRHADLVLRLLRADGEVDRQTIKSETGLRLGAEIDELEAVLLGAGLAELASIPREGGGRPRRLLRLPNGANGANGQGNAHPK